MRIGHRCRPTVTCTSITTCRGQPYTMTLGIWLYSLFYHHLSNVHLCMLNTLSKLQLTAYSETS